MTLTLTKRGSDFIHLPSAGNTCIFKCNFLIVMHHHGITLSKGKKIPPNYKFFRALSWIFLPCNISPSHCTAKLLIYHWSFHNLTSLCKQLVSEKEFGRLGSSYFLEGKLCKKLQMKVYFAEFSSALKPITEWKRKEKKTQHLEIISKFLEWVFFSCSSIAEMFLC